MHYIVQRHRKGQIQYLQNNGGWDTTLENVYLFENEGAAREDSLGAHEYTEYPEQIVEVSLVPGKVVAVLGENERD